MRSSSPAYLGRSEGQTRITDAIGEGGVESESVGFDGSSEGKELRTRPEVRNELFSVLCGTRLDRPQVDEACELLADASGLETAHRGFDQRLTATIRTELEEK